METGSIGTLESALASPFFNASPDGLVVVDAKGKIVACNPQVEEFLGYAPDELAGRPIEDLVPASLRTSHESHRSNYVKEPRIRPMGAGLHLRALCKNGQEIPVDISLSPFETEDGTFTIAAVRDATERLQAETAEVQADEWRAIIDDRQRIARDLHDTVIQDIFAAGMGLQALQRQMPEESMRDHLGTSIAHLDSVITRLRKVIFNLSRGDETEPIEAAARRVVLESVNGSGIDVDITINAVDGPLPARTQEHVLATLQEALSNAVRHAEASEVEIVIDAASDVLRLCVADNGIGMPDAAATRPGFGLTNMLNRAQVLGGSCDITPRNHGGTVVEWKVPL